MAKKNKKNSYVFGQGQKKTVVYNGEDRDILFISNNFVLPDSLIIFSDLCTIREKISELTPRNVCFYRFDNTDSNGKKYWVVDIRDKLEDSALYKTVQREYMSIILNLFFKIEKHRFHTDDSKVLKVSDVIYYMKDLDRESYNNSRDSEEIAVQFFSHYVAEHYDDTIFDGQMEDYSFLDQICQDDYDNFWSGFVSVLTKCILPISLDNIAC